MTYRFATIEDVPLLSSLNGQLIEDEQSPNTMTVEQLSLRLTDWLLQGNYRAVIFEENGAVVAYALYCTGERMPGEVFYFIRQFFVCREHRRRGIGREAIKRLSTEIIPRTNHLVLDVLFHNEIARKFWNSVGFTEHCITLELPPSKPA